MTPSKIPGGLPTFTGKTFRVASPISSPQDSWTHFESMPTHTVSPIAPTHRDDPNSFTDQPQDDDYWVYLDGQIGFGQFPWQVAEDLVRGMNLSEEEKNYFSNTIARNNLPEGIDAAIGQIKRGRPQIWSSNIDRNHVWDAVMRSLKNT